MEITLQNLNMQEKEQLWAERIHECRGSSLTVDNWCAKHDIKPATYYYWQHKIFKKAKSETKFAEIMVTESQNPTSLAVSSQIIAIITIQGIKAEIYAGSSADDIQNLMRGLKSC
ncbi:MAG: hypothetical protein R3Y07_08325 [Eubacteriales bacterium]